jgi:hypothetical protein
VAVAAGSSDALGSSLSSLHAAANNAHETMAASARFLFILL